MSYSVKSRRDFFKIGIFASSLMGISVNSLFASGTHLQTLKIVQKDLFPEKKIDDSNAYGYLSLILNHSRVSQESKNFLRNGATWLNEESLTRYNKAYIELNANDRQKILQIISKERWGRSWIKTVLTYIMEATLGDPIYGVNKKESGWKWLSHESGLPRPKGILL